MVKAVNIDESPNTLGNPPKESKPTEISISNPDDEVEFVVETGNDDLNIDEYGLNAVEMNENRILFEVTEDNFDLIVTGFDDL